MLRFFAALTGVGAIMSSPMLMLGVFMMLCAGLSFVRGTIGRDTGWTTLFSVTALVLTWAAPFLCLVAALAEAQKIKQRANAGSSWARGALKYQRGNIIQSVILGLFIPSLLVMLVAGFVANAACDRGDPAGAAAFLYNPLALILTVVTPLMGVPNPTMMCG